MAETGVDGRNGHILVDAHAQLQLAGSHHGGEYPVDGAGEVAGAVGQVGAEGEDVADTDLLVVGGGEELGVIGEVLSPHPGDVDESAVLGALDPGYVEAEAIEGVALAQEAVIVAHVDVFGLHLAAVGDGADEDLVGSLGKDEVTKPIGTGLESSIEDFLPVDLDDHRRRFDEDDAVLELAPLGAPGPVGVALLEGEADARGPGHRPVERRADVAEREALVALYKVVEAAPGAEVEDLRAALLAREVRGDGEVEVHPHTEDRGAVGDGEREQAVVERREVGGVVDHAVEGERTGQGQLDRLEDDGPAHPVLLAPVD